MGLVIFFVKFAVSSLRNSEQLLLVSAEVCYSVRRLRFGDDSFECALLGAGSHSAATTTLLPDSASMELRHSDYDPEAA